MILNIHVQNVRFSIQLSKSKYLFWFEYMEYYTAT